MAPYLDLYDRFGDCIEFEVDDGELAIEVSECDSASTVNLTLGQARTIRDWLIQHLPD